MFEARTLDTEPHRGTHVPGLIRRLSWQRLVDAFTCAPELAYLLAGLEGKYGITPE